MKKTIVDINNKFNIIQIAYSFLAPYHMDAVALRYLLSEILIYGSKNYPDRYSLNLAADNLYGLNITIGNEKYHGYNKIYFSLTFVDPKIINDPDYTVKAVLDFFNDIIFNTNITNHSFNKKILGFAKDDIKMEYDAKKDKPSFHHQEAFVKLVWKNTYYQYIKYDFMNEIMSITGKQLANEYERMLKEDDLYISVIGNLTEEELSLIPNYNDDIKLDYFNIKLDETKERIELSEPNDISILSQTYKTGSNIGDENYSKFSLFNYIFGANNLSLLFINVREQLGLCYTINTNIFINTGRIELHTRFDKKDYSKVIKAINDCIEKLKNGEISDIEFEEYKAKYIRSNLTYLDNNTYEFEKKKDEAFFGQFYNDPKKFIEYVKKLTKKDVMWAASKISLVKECYLRGE